MGPYEYFASPFQKGLHNPIHPSMHPSIHPGKTNAIQLESFQPVEIYLGDSTWSNTVKTMKTAFGHYLENHPT